MKNSKKLSVYNKINEQEPISPLYILLYSLFSILKIILTSILNIISVTLKIFLFLSLSITEEIIKRLPKGKKDPFRRSFSNANYKRLKNFNIFQTLINQKKIILVLEINELVISYKKLKSKTLPILGPNEIIIEVQNQPYIISLKKNYQEFFENIYLNFDLIIYTSIPKEIYLQIIQLIDPNCNIKHFYSEEQCIKHPKGLIKDISLASSDVTRTIIIDYNQQSVSLNLDNSLILDPRDTLEEYLGLLQSIKEQTFTDIRDILEEIRVEGPYAFA